LFLPAFIDVLEIKNDFVASSVFREDHAVAVDDNSPDAGFPDGDRVGSRNIGDEVGTLENLKFIEPRQKGSATYQHQSGEEIEPETVFWFHE
jgi:hypothetical protein